MKKITKITITNYRAFFNETTEAYQIDLPKGENLLVYGENGSGKSSLYHALSDFFESSDNNELTITENIFTQGMSSLREAAIHIEFGERVKGKWQPLETLTLNRAAPTTYANLLLKSASQAFLGYRDMLKTYFLAIDDFSKNPNLFDLFINKLLRKITEPTQNQAIQADLSKLDEDVRGFERLITEIMKDSQGTFSNEFSKDFDIGLDEKEVREEQQSLLEVKIDNFNQGLTSILNDTLELVNEYLSKYFKVNLQITLANEDKFLQLINNQGFLTLEKQLYFEIDYFGKRLEGTAYQTFLNEARLSALSICLYLAAIKKDKPTVANYKILFLDDIFIGLDTSNRLPLLEILNDDFKDYQIFMTTYDRMWFEISKAHLKGGWKAIEMFTHALEATDGRQRLEIPLIIDPSLNYLEKANLYFKKKDYPTSANFQRKWCEQFLKQYLQKNYKLEIGEGETALTITKLEVLFQKLRKFYKDCGKTLPEMIETEFSKHKETVLNPFSHDDLASPVYRAELERGFALIEAFEKLKPLSKKTIAYAEDLIQMELVKENYLLECVLKSDLLLIEHGTDKDFKCKVDAKRYKQANSEWIHVSNIKDKSIRDILKMVYDKFLKTDLPKDFDENTIFKLSNGKNLPFLKK